MKTQFKGNSVLKIGGFKNVQYFPKNMKLYLRRWEQQHSAALNLQSTFLHFWINPKSELSMTKITVAFGFCCSMMWCRGESSETVKKHEPWASYFRLMKGGKKLKIFLYLQLEPSPVVEPLPECQWHLTAGSGTWEMPKKTQFFLQGDAKKKQFFLQGDAKTPVFSTVICKFCTLSFEWKDNLLRWSADVTLH